MASRKLSILLSAFLFLAGSYCAWSQESTPIRIDVVTSLSGPGAGPMGIPGRNAAELTFDALNAGAVPAPYQSKDFGGTPIEMVLVDEAGSTSNVVTQYRNLVQRQNAVLVIGYISSGSCMAVAPVAEELKILTVIFNCGTPRLFEDASYKYVFRSAYEKRYGVPPPFAAYHMVQAILGTKAAYETAKAAANGKDPGTDQVIAAFQGLSFETPSGATKMALGDAHQGIQPMVHGMTKAVGGKLTMTNVTRYSAEQVNPPEGVKSEDWIKSGFAR